jgi:hypothetical protein
MNDGERRTANSERTQKTDQSNRKTAAMRNKEKIPQYEKQTTEQKRKSVRLRLLLRQFNFELDTDLTGRFQFALFSARVTVIALHRATGVQEHRAGGNTARHEAP